jgi:CDP-glucose 4,6-dehydratase
MSFWQERRVFVTGASGLLGSWLVDALLAKGATVTCLVRDWVPASRLLASGAARRTNLVSGSLENYELLLRALNEYEIDTVFHLAAQTIVGTASRSALSTFETNVRGTWNLLEACRACGALVQRVVVASSDKAYGSQRNLPYREDTPLEGRFPYDASKSCADLIAQSYFQTYRTPVTITRCVNLFGGGDLSFNRLVPGTILSALRDQPPIIRSNGRLVRDYIYVQSAVDAYLQLAERMPDDLVLGEAFNFGYGEPVTVLELVQTMLRLMGKTSLSPVVLNQAHHEIEEQYLDSSKAERVLGWRPRHTREESLRETIQWYERYNSGIETPAGLAT